MSTQNRFVKLIPIIAYLAFMLLQTIVGILLIAGLLPKPPIGVYPKYEPLTYLDLLYLYLMNIPTFIVISVALFRINKGKEEK